jgi:hypothetical protein
MREMSQTKKLNDVQRAKVLVKILQVKGELDVYDVMLQFEISYTRAIPIMKLVRRICEAMEICTYDEKEHKLVSLNAKKEKVEEDEEEDEEEEIDEIIDEKPANQ